MIIFQRSIELPNGNLQYIRVVEAEMLGFLVVWVEGQGILAAFGEEHRRDAVNWAAGLSAREFVRALKTAMPVNQR